MPQDIEGLLTLHLPAGPMTTAALAEYLEQLLQADLDPAVSVVHLEGGRDGFGGDLEDGVGAGEAAEVFVELLLTLRSMPKPVLASVQGQASGEALALVAAADIVLAAESATFRFAAEEGAVSRVPLGVALLVDLLGRALVTDLLLTGRWFDTVAAERLGLVSRVVTREVLPSAVGRLTRELRERGPTASGLAKRVVHRASADLAEALAVECRVRALGGIPKPSDKADG